MKPIVKGMFARSLAGHDKGRLYVISDVQEPYVFLVDGSSCRCVPMPWPNQNRVLIMWAEKEEADSRTAGLRNDGCGS